MPVWFRAYLTAPLLTLLPLYFASGLPLALTASTLAAWFFDAKVDIKAIGFIAGIGTPYALKFLWSPFMDELPFPVLSKRLGRRRGWILATQLALVAALLTLAVARPDINPFITGLVAAAVAFLSASQDIVIDAYRVEILSHEDQGRGAAVAQLGYRLGMIASGAGALYLAGTLGWQMTYVAMAALMGIGILALFVAKEAPYEDTKRAGVTMKAHMRNAVINPFVDFMKHKSWWLILLFIVIYKFADAFIGIVTNPFLLQIGFHKEQIAEIVKVYGTIATLFGIFAGGTLVVRYGAVRIMFIAGLLHAITNLLYSYQAHVGADSVVLAVSVVVENLSGGVSAAAFVAFLSNLCNRDYTATQYALLSSLSAVARTWLATPAGIAAKYLGWEWFFALAALLALPGLLVLWWLQKRIGYDDAGNINQGIKENL